MIFAIFLPGYWTPSHSAQHVFIAVLYAAGLICIAPIRSRHRFDSLEEAYSLSEAFLWLGIYLIFNLKISDLSLPSQWWSNPRPASEFAVPVLLDDVGAHMVPAAPHTRTRRSPEGSPHHRGRRDYCRPHLCHQQTVPRLAAAYLGPDTSRYRTDWRCIVPSTLARSGSGRSSPRLYGRASVREGQTRDERRLCRTRPDNTSIHNASPATNQSRLSLWRRRIGWRRR